MPLQNRVHPDGTLHATSARGHWMGNRGGRLHDDDRILRRTHASKRWICCVLRFKGRQRQVMGQSYTEMFFYDEATALAAGHRPCFECRRSDAKAFASAWRRALGGTGRADDMDKVLHTARLSPPDDAPLANLPVGTIIQIGEQPYLIWGRQAHPWGWQGYGDAQPLPDRIVSVLTPAPIRAVLDAGYVPQVGLASDA
jgi:hypothetical protein